MRIATSVAASVQQTQIRDKNDINRSQDKNIAREERERTSSIASKSHTDKIAEIKERIKNGTYQMNLAATADKMAQSLLNL